jgi:hypothetical protein
MKRPVIPAEAGIQAFIEFQTPAFAGGTDFFFVADL